MRIDAKRPGGASRTTRCGTQRLRRVLAPGAVAGALLLVTSPSLAQTTETFKLFAQETVSFDDNVYRLPKSSPDDPAHDTPQRGDTYFTTSAGLSFDVPVARQRLLGSVTINDSRYRTHTNLDYTGHDARIAWQWQAGNDVKGTVGYSDTSAPQSFAGVQERVTDMLHTRQAVAGVTFNGERWLRLDLGVAWLDQTNGNWLNRYDNIDVLRGDVTLTRVWASKDTLGLLFRVEDGRYPERTGAITAVLPAAYRQYDTGPVFDWRLSAASRLRGALEYASRRWDTHPERDWDGFVGQLQYDWSPTEKLSLTAVARRQINPYETQKATFELISGVTLIPAWRPTERVDVAATFDYSERSYLGGPQAACGIAPGNSDRLASATLNLAWRPARLVTVQLGAQYQDCSSGIPRAAYTAGILSIGLRIGL